MATVRQTPTGQGLRPEGGDLRREGRVVLAEARRSRFRRRKLGRHLELRGKGLDVVVKLKGGCLAAHALLLNVVICHAFMEFIGLALLRGISVVRLARILHKEKEPGRE
jgi:hypothetical protein